MTDEPRRDLLLWCDGLVAWTIDRLYPRRSRQPDQEPFEVDSTELDEWRRKLYRFLARVSLHLEPNESARRFVAPAAETDDETFGSLAESYVSLLTCNIMDETVLPQIPLAILGLMVPRLLSHSSWEQAGWNDGALHDAELSHMIRAVFFIDVEKALEALRVSRTETGTMSQASFRL